MASDPRTDLRYSNLHPCHRFGAAGRFSRAFSRVDFSPGFGGIYSEYQSFIENIVSHGYVIAAINNHPYTSGITVFPDGRMAMLRDVSTLEELEARHRVLVDDIEFLAASLETMLQKELDLVVDYIIAFFDVYLKDAPVKRITAIDYPEAVLEYTGDKESASP